MWWGQFLTTPDVSIGSTLLTSPASLEGVASLSHKPEPESEMLSGVPPSLPSSETHSLALGHSQGSALSRMARGHPVSGHWIYFPSGFKAEL